MIYKGRPTIGNAAGVTTYTSLEPRYRTALAYLAMEEDRTLSNYLRKVFVTYVDKLAENDESILAILQGEKPHPHDLPTHWVR